MATKTQTNYTPEQTLEIVELFASGSTVEQIAEKFGKSARSIIAKLSREGVYKSKAKQTGSKRVTKADLLAQIERGLGLAEGTLNSLEKGSYEALEVLHREVLERETMAS